MLSIGPSEKKTVCLCRHRPKIKGSKRILTSPKPIRENLWNRGWIKKCPGRSKGTNFMSFNRVTVKTFSPEDSLARRIVLAKMSEIPFFKGRKSLVFLAGREFLVLSRYMLRILMGQDNIEEASSGTLE